MQASTPSLHGHQNQGKLPCLGAHRMPLAMPSSVSRAKARAWLVLSRWVPPQNSMG